MRKLLMTLLFCTAALGVKAQFDKNTAYFSTSLTGVGLSYSNQEKFTLGVDVLGGFFVEQSWMLFGRFGYNHTHEADDVTIGAGMRYYISQNGLYLGSALQYQHLFKNINNVQICPEVGYTFFLNRFVTLEPSVYYNISLNNFSDGSKVGLRIGFGFYF